MTDTHVPHDSELEIIEVDVHDDALLQEWFDVTAPALREGLGDLGSFWTLPELTVALREPSQARRVRIFLGRAGGVPVVGGGLVMPLLENLDKATVRSEVHPAHRRRGFGTTMLAHVEARALEHGRTEVDFVLDWTEQHGPEGVGWPGREFALARGYRLVLGDVQRVLQVPVADDTSRTWRPRPRRTTPATGSPRGSGPCPTSSPWGGRRSRAAW